jgi:Adenylate and Guanylate cyclase catalytic domain
MNTAARMESHSKPGRIQMTEETANMLIKYGKSSWLILREDIVIAKGKGAMKTFWLNIDTGVQCSVASMAGDDSRLTLDDESTQSPSVEGRMRRKMAEEAFKLAADKKARLVSWHLETMSRLLKQIVASRGRAAIHRNAQSNGHRIRIRGNTPMDEVVEVIHLPKAVKSVSKFADSINLDEVVVAELRQYISSIADMYKTVRSLKFFSSW